MGRSAASSCLLILLDEPNVLVLDEPTNDLDTDMLAAMEDLLDSWPGTLLVVSHDRYLLERITDQQYAILDGHFRHLPGGVDQYLRLRKEQDRPARPRAPVAAVVRTVERRAAQHQEGDRVDRPQDGEADGAHRRAAHRDGSARSRPTYRVSPR